MGSQIRRLPRRSVIPCARFLGFGINIAADMNHRRARLPHQEPRARGNETLNPNSEVEMPAPDGMRVKLICVLALKA
jgi:hypothetical protein